MSKSASTVLACLACTWLTACRTIEPTAAAGLEVPPSLATETELLLDQIEAAMPAAYLERWRELVTANRTALARAKTEAARLAQLNAMLGNIGVSHFQLLPASLAEDQEKDAQRQPSGELGLVLRVVEGKSRIVRLEPDSPAAASPIAIGWQLESVDDQRPEQLIERIQALGLPDDRAAIVEARVLGQLQSGPVGTTATVALRDLKGRRQRFALTYASARGERYRFGHLPPLAGRVRSQRLAGNLGYLHFNIFLMPLMPAIRQAMADLADTDGLVLDLRGNPGGLGAMAMPVAGLLVAERATLGTSHMPRGDFTFAVFPAPRPYRQPVVALVDESTGSTAELLIAGLQELGRVRVVGRPTMGQVMPSVVEELPGGQKLQVAIADFTTPGGKRLEGIGVQPDVPVVYAGKDLENGRDPLLEAAIRTLNMLVDSTSQGDDA